MAPTPRADNVWAYAILVCTLLLSALFLYALFVPPSANSSGLPHPDYSSLLQGGSGIDRHGSMLWLGWAIGAVEILLCVALVALGARRGARLAGDTPRDIQHGDLHDSLRGMGWPLTFFVVAYLAVWTLLMLAYTRYLHDPAPDLILALPAPTAIMLYLLWPLPLILAGFYVIGFHRWVFSQHDEEAFRQLVAKRRAREQQAESEAG